MTNPSSKASDRLLAEQVLAEGEEAWTQRALEKAVRESRARINSVGKLPDGSGAVLEGMVKGVADHYELGRRKPRFMAAVLNNRRAVLKDLPKLQRDLSSLRTLLARTRPGVLMDDTAADLREDAALDELERAIERRREWGPVLPPISGRPPFPDVFYTRGADAVLKLLALRSKRDPAARATTFVLQPLLEVVSPRSVKPKTFAARTLLAWMREQHLLPPASKTGR